MCDILKLVNYAKRNVRIYHCTNSRSPLHTSVPKLHRIGHHCTLDHCMIRNLSYTKVIVESNTNKQKRFSCKRPFMVSYAALACPSLPVSSRRVLAIWLHYEMKTFVPCSDFIYNPTLSDIAFITQIHLTYFISYYTHYLPLVFF